MNSDFLTEKQCSVLEKALTDAVEPRKVAAYLCLHMGLTLAEVAGLRREDVDADGGSITLRNYIGKPEGAGTQIAVEFLSFDEPRTLAMPGHVKRFLENHIGLYADGKTFIMSGESSVPAFYMMQNILNSVNLKYRIADTLSVSDLRSAFVRRCIENGVDLYTLCDYIGIRQPNVVLKRYRQFFTARQSEISCLEKYSSDYVPEPVFDANTPKSMNLLILGAGSQGAVVKEIAEEIGIFDEIGFLDDDPKNPLAMGTLSDLAKLKYRFPLAIPSFGDSELRARWLGEIDKLGILAPSLIHPSVTLSPKAQLGRAVVIEARCIVSAGAVIGKGAILSGASVIEPYVRIGQFVHIGASSTVAKGASVEDYKRIPSGTVVRVI